MYRVYTFISGKNVGFRERPAQQTRDQLHVPFSTHYFCPACGEVWAKVVVLDEGSKHCTLARKCPQHGLGSMLSVWDEYLNLSLPIEAIIREIDLCLANPDAYIGYLS